MVYEVVQAWRKKRKEPEGEMFKHAHDSATNPLHVMAVHVIGGSATRTGLHAITRRNPLWYGNDLSVVEADAKVLLNCFVYICSTLLHVYTRIQLDLSQHNPESSCALPLCLAVSIGAGAAVSPRRSSLNSQLFLETAILWRQS